MTYALDILEVIASDVRNIVGLTFLVIMWGIGVLVLRELWRV